MILDIGASDRHSARVTGTSHSASTMAFVKPAYSKGEVNRAGEILKAMDDERWSDQTWATEVLTNWRASHAYPINTFQKTLRDKAEAIDEDAIIAQRLKRTSSIVFKLQRFEGMQLARMQDIGGVRGVVKSLKALRDLEAVYRTGSRFKHKLVSSKDYITCPKDYGYRSIHLIYRYENDIKTAKPYSGLCIEMQLRTGLQHAGATAVETMGTFLGQALKSGEGEPLWRAFFQMASAAFAIKEGTAPGPGFEAKDRYQIYHEVAEAEEQLGVLHKLHGLTIAANAITREHDVGMYHLIALDAHTQTVAVRGFSKARLSEAIDEYAKLEKDSKGDQKRDVVLVSAGNVSALRRAYPNYFLDTHGFIEQVKQLIATDKKAKRKGK